MQVAQMDIDNIIINLKNDNEKNLVSQTEFVKFMEEVCDPYLLHIKPKNKRQNNLSLFNENAKAWQNPARNCKIGCQNIV